MAPWHLGVLALSFLALLAGAIFFAKRMSSPPLEDRLANFPSVILWAWERPEHLEFIDPHTVGVAFLARTVTLQGEQVFSQPRLQPLTVPPGTSLMAVVRIESDRERKPLMTRRQRAAAVAAIRELLTLPGISAIQIDFDATVSERAFYRGLLFDLRAVLPATMPLSITALTSWCLDDDWLGGLPVDEAIPMLFRMGTDDAYVRRQLAAGRAFHSPLCRHSLGISTDEPLPHLPLTGKRLYIFHPKSWSPAAFDNILSEVRNSK